jgi:hypothetical protein
MEITMSKNSGSDLVAVLEYLDRKTSFKPPKGSGRRGNKLKFSNDLDIISMIKKRKEEAEALEKFLKDQKKEEKKDEKKSAGIVLTGLEWFIIGMFSYPIIGPLYQMAIKSAGVH